MLVWSSVRHLLTLDPEVDQGKKDIWIASVIMSSCDIIHGTTLQHWERRQVRRQYRKTLDTLELGRCLILLLHMFNVTLKACFTHHKYTRIQWNWRNKLYFTRCQMIMKSFYFQITKNTLKTVMRDRNQIWLLNLLLR